MKKRSAYGLILLFLVCASHGASPDSQDKHSPTAATENLLIDNLNLSGQDFWILYQSPDVLKRRIAEAYLMGVLDSSEGKAWCSYTIASPDALQEQTYIEFKKATPSILKKRASEIIIEIFSRKLPCRSKKLSLSSQRLKRITTHQTSSEITFWMPERSTRKLATTKTTLLSKIPVM